MRKFTRKQIAIGSSLLAHGLLLCVLIFWYAPQTGPQARPQPTATTTSPAAKQSTKTKETPDRLPKPMEAPADVPPEQISRSVETQIESAARLPDEVKRSELEKNLKRLESLSTPASVEQVSATIANSMGIDATQYAEKESVPEGPFDIKSSQIKDIERTKDDKGNWRYESLMVDAEGRTMRVPLTAGEGKDLYETFDRLKSFPMAKGIYQSVVMPMLQKMIESQEPPTETKE